MPLTCSDICKILFALLFPPLGVFLEVGCSVDLLINVGLTLLGFYSWYSSCLLYHLSVLIESYDVICLVETSV